MIAILEALTKYKSINIVVTSSISSKEGSYDPIYASTKAGLDSFRIRCASISSLLELLKMPRWRQGEKIKIT